jgi:hypothetical protein
VAGHRLYEDLLLMALGRKAFVLHHQVPQDAVQMKARTGQFLELMEM